MNNIYCHLARQAIENYLKTGVITPLSPDLPKELLDKKAGVFVSLHKKNDQSLRGCIGTFMPTKRNISQEIISNAIEAATGDPRFCPVELKELGDLEISVDILSDLEKVESEKELDAKKFGILVSDKIGRRGLLLPDLDGVKTVKQQVEIACQKAGIDYAIDKINLHRFTVKRYKE